MSSPTESIMGLGKLAGLASEEEIDMRHIETDVRKLKTSAHERPVQRGKKGISMEERSDRVCQ